MGDNNLQGSIQKAAHDINNKPTFKMGDQKPSQSPQKFKPQLRNFLEIFTSNVAYAPTVPISSSTKWYSPNFPIVLTLTALKT
jgi:hypothetical protein